jgi:pimeloyl-ACP methyl ester carboxylesterase
VGLRERFVSNDGLRIRYLDNDPAEPVGLPILFFPGVFDDADDYGAVLEFFRSRRVLVVEMRGRGGSDAPVRGYAVAEQAGDVEAVIAANGLRKFHVMTFSRGTTPAIEVAWRRPRRAVTLAIGDYLPIELGLPPQYAETQWRGRWRGRPIAERVPRHVLEQIQADSRQRELWREVAGLGIPVLVARHHHGGIISDPDADHYRRAVPQVEVATLPGAGHDLFRPDRTAYAEAVDEFIARRAPGT